MPADAAPLIRVIRDTCGLIFIDGRNDPMPGGLQATLSGTLITIANTQGGRAIACDDFSRFADASGAGFASPDAALAYLSAAFAAPPSTTIEGVAAADIAAGQPLAISRASGRAIAARADTYAASFVAGLALAAASAGFPARGGRGAVTSGDWSAVTGSAALLQGQPYFLAPGGGLATTAINPGAVCVARVGLAASPTTLIVAPGDPILL